MRRRGFLSGIFGGGGIFGGSANTNSGNSGGVTGAITGAAGGGILSGLGSALGGGLENLLLGDLVQPAMFLGTGLGNGAVTGLDLPTKSIPQEATEETSKPTAVDRIAQNLGEGLTSSIFSKVNMTALLNQLSGGKMRFHVL